MPTLSLDEMAAELSANVPPTKTVMSIEEMYDAEPVTPQRKFNDYLRVFRKPSDEKDPRDILRQTVGRLPVVGGALNAASALADISDIKAAMNDPNADDETLRNGAAAVAYYEKQSHEDPSFGEQVLNGLFDLPGYAAEFALTGGAYSGAKTAVEAGAKKALGQFAESTAAKVATGVASRAAGVAAQTVANPGRIAQSASERQLQKVLADPSADNSLLESLPAGFLDTFIELGSERAGSVLAKGASKIPGVKQLGAVKDAIAQKWFGMNPGAKVPDLLAKIRSKTGWNGILGEMMEERTGEAARNVTGLEQGGVLPGGWKQLAAEAAVLAVPGIAGHVVQKALQSPVETVDKFVANPSRANAKALGLDLPTVKDRQQAAEAIKTTIAQEQSQNAAQPELSDQAPAQETVAPENPLPVAQAAADSTVIEPEQVDDTIYEPIQPGKRTGSSDQQSIADSGAGTTREAVEAQVQEQVPAQEELPAQDAVAPEAPAEEVAPPSAPIDEAPPEAINEEPPSEDFDPNTTSARKAQMAQDREAMGLDVLNSPERRSWQKAMDDATQEGIPDRAMQIAEEVNAKPRSLSDTETAGMVVQASKLKSEHAALMRDISVATDTADIQTKGAELNRIEQHFDQLSRALRVSGTEKGRALAAQKLTIDQNFDLVSVKSRAKAAKGGNLSVKESAQLTELTTKLNEQTARVAELESKMNEQIAERALREVKVQRRSYTKPAREAELSDLYQRAKVLLANGCKD
jgi:hypothetical protein